MDQVHAWQAALAATVTDLGPRVLGAVVLWIVGRWLVAGGSTGVKIDMADAAGFDRPQTLGNLASMAPQARILEVSARTGSGLEAWYQWLD